ncbi:hypothetical protein ACS0TY_002828 [Phlomoides rotata]
MAPPRGCKRRVNRDETPELQRDPMEQDPSQQAETEQAPRATPGADFAREILTSLQDFIRQQVHTPPPPPNPPMPHVIVRVNDFVEQFRRLQPPRLNGKEGPLETEEWIAGLERIFRHLTLTDTQKISCAQFQLKEDAAQWWESYERTLDPEERQAFLWEDFKEAVMERYFPRVLRDQKEQEFVTLLQGTLSVTEYERKFNQLSRYAPHLVEDDVRKGRRFERGMRPEIRGILAGANLLSYREVFSRALNISIGLKLEHKQSPATVPINRNWQTTFKGNSIPPPNGNNYNASRHGQYCATCGKRHLGRCLLGTVTCYRCHRTGHKASDCHLPPNANHQQMGNNQYRPQPVSNYQTRQPPTATNRQGQLPVRGPPNQGHKGSGHVNAILEDGDGSGGPPYGDQELPEQHETLAVAAVQQQLRPTTPSSAPVRPARATAVAPVRPARAAASPIGRPAEKNTWSWDDL